VCQGTAGPEEARRCGVSVCYGVSVTVRTAEAGPESEPFRAVTVRVYTPAGNCARGTGPTDVTLPTGVGG